MKNENPGCISQQMQNNSKDWHLLDEFYYMPEDMWPKDATIIDDRRCYLWFRKTPWKCINEYNKKNKEVFDYVVDKYLEKHPELGSNLSFEELNKNDELWKILADKIITNAFIERNYVMEEDYVDDPCFPHIQSKLKNFDVVMQTTLGGYLTHPFVVYGIEYQDTYYADIKYDDYANEQFKGFNEKWGINNSGDKNKVMSEEQHRKWLEYGYIESEELRVQMIKEGHATYSVRKPCREYRMGIRWVEHNSKDLTHVLHKGQY